MLPVTVEHDHALRRAAEWLDQAYLWATDVREKAELSDDGVLCQVPGEDRGERVQGLLWQVQDRVIPDVAAAPPNSVEEFRELGDRFRALCVAVYGPWSEFGVAVDQCRAALRKADQAVRSEAAPESPQETLAESSDPRVPATPKSATSRRKREDYTCPQCSIAFEPSRTDQKYCGPACKTASYKERKQSEAGSG